MNQTLEAKLGYQTYVMQPGNRIELTYYTGVEAGNPSGVTTNVKYVDYKSRTITPSSPYNLAQRLELTYDAANNLLTTTNITL
jgi:hypothetical protein